MSDRFYDNWKLKMNCKQTYAKMMPLQNILYNSARIVPPATKSEIVKPTIRDSLRTEELYKIKALAK